MENIKTVLAVIGLVAIGFVGGFITHRQMVKQEVRKVVRMGEAPMFLRHLNDVMEPTEAQLEALEPIMKEHASNMARFMLDSREKRQALIHELEEQVEPILTPEQIERLHQFNRRFRNRDIHRKRRMQQKGERIPRIAKDSIDLH